MTELADIINGTAEQPPITAAKQRMRIKLAESVGNKREVAAAKKKLQEAYELEDRLKEDYYEYDYYEALQASYSFVAYQPIAELFRYKALATLQIIYANGLAAKYAGSIKKGKNSARIAKKAAAAIGDALDAAKQDIACARFIEAQLGSKSAYTFITDTHKGADGQETSLYAAMLEDVEDFLAWASENNAADVDSLKSIRRKARTLEAYQGKRVKRVCAKAAKEHPEPHTQAGGIAALMLVYADELEDAAKKETEA